TRMHDTFRAPELSATSSIDSCWTMAASPIPSRPASDDRGLGERRLHLPALALGEGPVLDDAHPVAHLAGVVRVVRHEARIAAHVLLVAGVAHEPLDPHHHRLVHLVADDGPVEGPPRSSLAHRLAPAFSRSSVSTRAMSRRRRRSFAVFSSCPVAWRTFAAKCSRRSSSAFARSSSTVSSRSSDAFTPSPPARRSAS